MYRHEKPNALTYLFMVPILLMFPRERIPIWLRKRRRAKQNQSQPTR